MQTKNDEWIASIQALEQEINMFQGTSAQTEEMGNALHYLAITRFWLQEDKVKITQAGRSEVQLKEGSF
jgi:hypothetical protein